MQQSQPLFLDTAGAARHLHLSPKTLEKWRVVGGGPRFRKHGSRVVYALEDLQDWSDRRARVSTSETYDAR